MSCSKQSKFFKTGLLALALLMAPGYVMAQDSCAAEFNAVVDPNSEKVLNEPIGIQIELGAGDIVDGSNENPYLDISQFEYHMDCTAGDSFPTCTNPDNTVEFAGNIQTDCRDETDTLIATFDTTVLNEVVTFVPQAPSTVIRAPANTTCNVSFDIRVTGIAPGNAEQEIVELTGWLTSTTPSQALCSNGLPAGGGASVSFNLETTSTIFRVTKAYSDTNQAPVDVHLVCDAGLPLTQSFTLAPGGDVEFTVRSYNPGQLDCRVFEDPIPDGYVPDYVAGATTGIGLTSDDDEACYFNEVVNGVFTCDITNNAEPGMFTVNKVWILDEEGEGVVDQDVDVTISCDSEILTQGAVFDQQSGYWTLSGTIGDGGSLTAEVSTLAGTANCMGEEDITDDFVASQDDCGLQPVPPASDVQCTFVNSVFFEGIPTLSQYGIALMALLMLGIGMVGFRRFA